jgi:glutathione S-transferase
MHLTLHFHPLASFCWKALIGLYELEIPFEKNIVDLADPAARDAFARLWPIAKFPVLRDDTRGRTVPESTCILEYAERLGGSQDKLGRLIPADPESALKCRLRDRLYDSYIHLPMQKIVGDRLRPNGARDPFGVEQARSEMANAYALADQHASGGPWAMGSDFTLADCAAMPALFYGDKVLPIDGRWNNLAAYLERLKRRPSVARVLKEAEPYFHLFPVEA